MSIVVAHEGANRAPKAWYSSAEGVNRKLKRIFAARDGVNRKIYSGYDCQAHNTNNLLTIDAFGALYANFFSTNAEWRSAFYLAFSRQIAFSAGQTIATIDYSSEGSIPNFVLSTSSQSSDNFQTERITNIADHNDSAGKYTLIASKGGALSTFYFVYLHTFDNCYIRTPNAAITFMGQKLTSIEII